jgi:NH3-dependent NAD+ synthetase
MDRDIHTLMESAIASMQSYIERGHVLAAGVSGGKDSTCAMVLMLEAVRRAKQVALARRRARVPACTVRMPIAIPLLSFEIAKANSWCLTVIPIHWIPAM